MDEIVDYVGRRDNVLTFYFGGDMIVKEEMAKVYSMVKQMKREDRKARLYHLMGKMRKVEKFGGHGKIVCIAEDLYVELDVPTYLWEFRYVYSDRFDLRGIKEVLYLKLFFHPFPKDIMALNDGLSNLEGVAIGDHEIDYCIKRNLLSRLFIGIDCDLEIDYLDKLIGKGIKVMRMNRNLTKYGDKVGLMWYPQKIDL